MRKQGCGPLIHCITNPISMMQCANTILGLGARPIMAEHPLEVKEVTATADALLINLGNISDSRMEAMKISFEEAVRKDIPVVIDAVGVACSSLRREFISRLLEKRGSNTFLVIKGNYSEIMALYDDGYKSEGVDAKEGISTEVICDVSKKLSEKYNAVILASGMVDVVVQKSESYFVHNGCLELSKITGTGCMLGAICAALLSEKRDAKTVADACAVLGIAGEMAANPDVGHTDIGMIGSGTFLIRLLDNISLMNDDLLQERRNVK
ncbi:hydroxyethylthiazole kinase [Butyrivibrio sp. VCD2006]|uniref:hydroxyethylthiazole kinase n=1 Tax=Butyrivibrio sp. VCD2006 TaxID=1280664 RepID=UPI0004180A37|nr:hydroxyethylthiazole kinase [Butyrivibrio sp. VCD2006]